MPRKNSTLDELVESAANAPTGAQRRAIAASGRSLVKPKAKTGRPTRFNEDVAARILSAISQGKTLLGVCADLDLGVETIYGWLRVHPTFAENYRVAREQMAQTLVDEMVEDARNLDPDMAVVGKVKSQVYQWVASRYDVNRFGDAKRIELSGEVRHRHVHELPAEQKRRIAESWLISQGDDSPGIVAETSGPALPELEAAGVQESDQGESRIIPKKKKAALPKSKPTDDDGTDWSR